MIALANEALISFKAARDAIPGIQGRRISISTLHRWQRQGLRGVRLESAIVAGVRYTSVEAMERFIRATTDVADRKGVNDAK